MSMIGGALSRTRPVMKQERVIGLAMSKWWKKKRPADAEVCAVPCLPEGS